MSASCLRSRIRAILSASLICILPFAGGCFKSESSAPPASLESDASRPAVGDPVAEQVRPRTARAAVRPELESFIGMPDLKNLIRVKELCKAGDFKWDESEVILERLSNTSEVNGARFLVYMRENCADGALVTDLDGILGVDLLLEKPALVLRAIAAEKPHVSTVRSFADSHGKSGEGIFADCDAHCVPGVEDFYGNRISAIESISEDADLKEIRETVLQQLKDARKDWIDKLRSIESEDP